MAKPTIRTEFKQYCLRQLGAPVLEINIADEQCDDLIDDAIQYFQERHFDGVIPMFMKYKFTEQDVNRGTATNQSGSTNTAGIVTTTASTSISGIGTTSFNWYETSNFIQVPPEIIGITKIFRYDGTQTITSNMFSLKYQMFLNDMYYWGSLETLSYAMTKTYLSDLDFLLNTGYVIYVTFLDRGLSVCSSHRGRRCFCRPVPIFIWVVIIPRIKTAGSLQIVDPSGQPVRI